MCIYIYIYIYIRIPPGRWESKCGQSKTHDSIYGRVNVGRENVGTSARATPRPPGSTYYY